MANQSTKAWYWEYGALAVIGALSIIGLFTILGG